MLSTIVEIQRGQGLGSGYKWLAGLVFRVCMGVFWAHDSPCDDAINFAIASPIFGIVNIPLICSRVPTMSSAS